MNTFAILTNPLAPRHGRAVLAALLIAAASPIAHAATHVKDGAGLFSSGATQQAEQQLDSLQSSGSGKNVIVETMGEPPASVRDAVNGSTSQRDAAMLQLAEQRAQSAGADVYVLINKTPGNLQIAEKKALQSGGLPAATRTQVANAMLSSFKSKDFDGGLTQGVSMLTQSLGNAPASAGGNATPSAQRDDTPTPPVVTGNGGNATAGHGLFGGLFSGGCCTIVGVGLLIVIGLMIYRAFSRRSTPTYGGPANYGGQPGYPQQGGYYPQQRSGGGFGSGLGGGLLGGALGSVLGNMWGRGHGNGSGGNSGGGIFTGGGGGAEPGPSQDTGYVGGGGDFGGGGGDFGGGDAGGGDYTGGGGDIGGGGDGGGSSGGDF